MRAYQTAIRHAATDGKSQLSCGILPIENGRFSFALKCRSVNIVLEEAYIGG